MNGEMTINSVTAPVLWTPSSERVRRAEITRYAEWVADRAGRHVTASYDALWRWSVGEPEEFWRSIWDYFEVAADGASKPVLASREMPGARWFPYVRLSYPEHVFRGRSDDEVAVWHASELRELSTWTWGELREHTERIAAGLRRLGVGQGDRVVAYLPNIPEAFAAFLACASLGAIWSSCSPDFGARAVADRLGQVEPKVLLAVDGYRYGGREFDRRDVVAALSDELPGLEHTVVLPYLGSGDVAGATPWAELVTARELLAPVRVPFDHPLWILYSSGTTGLPKAIVHGHGGVLLEQLKHQHLHLDAQAGDRVFWFTTTGWMMWNFLAGVLLTPASIVLYDGNPGHPDLGTLWDVADRAGVTTFGTSAAFLASCRKTGVEPAAGRDLSRLTSVGSTGSPLAPEDFRWVYDELGDDTWLFSTSGGTDVCTAFVGGVPVVPVHDGELQARALGADVQSWDADGRPLVGEVGELVLPTPLPSMPVCFWGDADGARYGDAYFSTYPGVWRHGDWIEITERGSAVIHGRSDATINRGGIRMGSSEIYRSVLAVDDVVDALVVDVPQPGGDGWMTLFVVLRDGVVLDETLTRRIATRIREDCSPRHVPNEVHAVAAIPRTLSGKVLEVPVKRILMGHDPDAVASRDSLANPEALDWFAEFARERATSGGPS
jgi:acetoacetyl-CoA synthetase